ncbi:unnamed protein product, partial [Ectocarpus sp. 12 AP-2014]
MKAIKTFRKMSRSQKDAQFFKSSMEVAEEEGVVVTGERKDGDQVLEGEVKLEEEPEEQQTNRRSPRRTIEELDESDGKKGEHDVPPSEPSRAPSPDRKEEEEPDGQQTNRQSPRQAPGELDEAEGVGSEKGDDVAAIEKEHDVPPSDMPRAPPPESKEESTEADAGVSRDGSIGYDGVVISPSNSMSSMGSATTFGAGGRTPVGDRPALKAQTSFFTQSFPEPKEETSRDGAGFGGLIAEHLAEVASWEEPAAASSSTAEEQNKPRSLIETKPQGEGTGEEKSPFLFPTASAAPGAATGAASPTAEPVASAPSPPAPGPAPVAAAGRDAQ